MNDVKEHYVGMPEFVSENKTAKAKIVLNFSDIETRNQVLLLLGYKQSPHRTVSKWYPVDNAENTWIDASSKRYVS